jgi:hypothetical protein
MSPAIGAAPMDRAKSHLFEPAERPRAQFPHRGAVHSLVVDGKPRAPERVEVAPDRARVDVHQLREFRDADSRPRRVDLAKNLPLPNEFAASRHARDSNKGG